MIAALAGRRIDPANAARPRFPEENVTLVRDRLRRVLAERGVRALVSSAACGADLIGQDLARELHVSRSVVLPFSPEVFRKKSVTDRPGDWGPVFDATIVDLREAPDGLVVLDQPLNEASAQLAYARTNEALLDLTARLAQRAEPRERPLAIAVWDGESRGPDDLTDQFMREARSRGFEVAEVLTL